MIILWKWTPRFIISVLATLVSVYIGISIWLGMAGHLSSVILQDTIGFALHKTVAECDRLESSNPSSACPISNSKYAYATILTGYNGSDSDKYFIAARLLTYQLVHDLRTKAQNSAQFIILVTKDVPAANRDILQRDGAVVLLVDSIMREWINPKWARWNDVMAKLNLWTFVDYEKIVFMDADTVLLDRLDDIFLEPATALQQTSPPISEPLENNNLPSLPETYMIAGIHDRWIEQNLPPEPGEKGFYAMNNYMNAGFLVLSPSQKMFEYYLALLDTRSKIDLTYPEQNLLNYAHRTDGRMPWKSLGSHWNAITTLNQHYAPDVRSLHHKWWQKVENQTVNDYVAGTVEKMSVFYNLTRVN